MKHVLENRQVAIAFDPDSGGFASLYDKRHHHEYVDNVEPACLVRAIMPDGDRRCNCVDGAEPKIVIQGNAATLEFVRPGLQGRIALALEQAALTMSATLTNTSEINVEEVVFPVIPNLTPFQEARLVLPCLGPRCIRDPFGTDLGSDHRAANDYGNKFSSRYPHTHTTAWIDYGNRDHGIALEGRPHGFSIMDFYVHKRVDKKADPVRRALIMAVTHPHRIRAGETWQSPQMRVLLHHGDWHVVADEHRQWLEQWIRKPARPTKFAESPGWHFFFMKQQDGMELYTYADLPRMAKAALDVGMPYLLLFGWHAPGHDNHYMYNYLPNEDWGGLPALREAVENVRAMGANLLPFYNGTLANIETPEHKEFGHRWEAKSRVGHPYYAGNWTHHSKETVSRNRDRIHHEICPCEEMREVFRRDVHRLTHEYGFGGIHLDQGADKMYPCYNATHRHASPDLACIEGFSHLLPEALELVRQAGPDEVMLVECANDFAGQWADGNWSWSVLEFPEPLLYSLPWVRFSSELDALEYAQANKCFLYKLNMDLRINGGYDLVTDYPEFAAHIRALADLRRRVLDYYIYADFRDQEGLTIRSGPPDVAKVFRNFAQNKVGIVLSELEGTQKDVAFRTEWRAASKRVRVEYASRETNSLDDAAEYAFTLAPYETCVLCIDLGSRQ